MMNEENQAVRKPSYARPPIVEAIVDFRFSEGIGRETVLDALQARLGNRFPDVVRGPRHLGGDSSAAEDGESDLSDFAYLRSKDRKRLLGCADGVLSIHVLAPYPGWTVLLGQSRTAMAALAERRPDLRVQRVSVRYIDLISLKLGPEEPLDKLFRVVPPRPSAMPSGLSDFHVVTHAVDPEDGVQATLFVASAPRDPESNPAVIYDLTVWREGNPLCDMHPDSWDAMVEEMHDRQRDVFEGCITDDLRRTFQ